MSKTDYKSAGVDIAAGNEAVNRIKDKIKTTFSSAVLTDIGSFGSMYDLKQLLQDYEHPVMVQSLDGVGTKTKVANLMNRYDTLGHDLLSATCNDIIVMGAKPLTFLDYIATDDLDPDIVEATVLGMVEACTQNEVSLVGGETAEMPSVYHEGEHDLVGIVTGVVEKSKIINGQSIKPGDKVFGLNSSGLHTNGYSLARKLLLEDGFYATDEEVPELGAKLGDVLLEPHINYTKPVLDLLDQGVDIHGMAHITGGGFIENIPRVLPDGCAVTIHKNTWPVLPIFTLMQRLGELDDADMYQTFNMGIGLVIIADQNQQAKIAAILKNHPHLSLYDIGVVEAANQKSVTFKESS